MRVAQGRSCGAMGQSARRSNPCASVWTSSHHIDERSLTNRASVATTGDVEQAVSGLGARFAAAQQNALCAPRFATVPGSLNPPIPTEELGWMLA